MLVKPLNLEKELLAERRKRLSEAALLEEVEALLAENENQRNQIIQKLQEKDKTTCNALQFDLLATDNIFHSNQIEAICVKYRLRFLESSLYKNSIPEEAISKIRAIESAHNTSLEGFKIAAPSIAFHLKNYDDPLLFVPIGNNYYYLIHRWGNDLHPLRKWLVLPLKNLWTFTVTAIIISALLTCLVPETNLSKSVPLAPVIIFLFIFKSIFAIFAYYFFMMGKNFNSEIWQRKYYNN